MGKPRAENPLMGISTKMNGIKDGIKISGSKSKRERRHESKVVLTSILAILGFASISLAILYLRGDVGTFNNHLRSITDSVLALLFAVIILDRIVAFGNERRRRGEERKSILRHHTLIQSILELFLVRKNMVITPDDKTSRKFQIKTRTKISDMRDMFNVSDLASDVGKTRIEMYRMYQNKLLDKFIRLVESIDFAYYPEVLDSAMRFINVTTYSESVVDALVEAKGQTASMKSNKAALSAAIRDSDDYASIRDVPGNLKNVYNLHEAICEQEDAVQRYVKALASIMAEEDGMRERERVSDDA